MKKIKIHFILYSEKKDIQNKIKKYLKSLDEKSIALYPSAEELLVDRWNWMNMNYFVVSSFNTVRELPMETWAYSFEIKKYEFFWKYVASFIENEEGYDSIYFVLPECILKYLHKDSFCLPVSLYGAFFANSYEEGEIVTFDFENTFSLKSANKPILIEERLLPLQKVIETNTILSNCA